jgi:hypothetical protein
MKTKLLLFAICYLPIALFAQTSQTGSDYIARRIQLTLSNAPQPVTNASVSVSGNPGPATYYYWIVTQNSLGASSPAGPFQVINAPNTLTVSNFNQISWATAPGGATYDVLRTSNTGPPFAACNCAVATAVTGNSVNDQSNALSSYTVNTLDPSSLVVVLQNIGGALSPGTPQILPALTVTGNASIKGPRPWVDVTAFGAKGDASTDDTTSIQNAINFACTGTTSAPVANLCPNAVSGTAVGGEVYLPAGDYHTSAPLLLYGGIRLVGAGKLATKITKTTNTAGSGSITAGTGVGRSPTACGGGTCVDSFAVDSIISVPYISSGNTDYAYRWTIRDMALYGSGTNGTKYGIYAPRSAQAEIKNLYIFMNCSQGAPANCGSVQGNGFWTEDAWLMRHEGNTVDSSWIGWNHVNDGSNIGAGTSSIFSDDWGVNIGCSGFHIFGLSYSNMNANAVDNFNKKGTDLAASDLTCEPYSFNTASGMSINGGGAENVTGGIMYAAASSITISGGFKTFSQTGYTSAGTFATIYMDSAATVTMNGTSFSAVTSPGNIFNIVLQGGSTLIDTNSSLPSGGNTFIGYGGGSTKIDTNNSGITLTNGSGTQNITATSNLTKTIANGTAAMTTAGIGTGACGTTVTVAGTGILTTDTIDISHNAPVTIGNGGGLTLNAWPTAGNVNFNYCNSAAGTITPTAMTVNWSVRRP